MTTSAAPTAATATIEASTATCEMLSTVRNWGAAIDTRAPSTTMIATRLSSRCRATTPSHAPLSRGAARLTAALDSVIGATIIDGVGREVAGGGGHDPLFRRLGPCDLGGDPSFV